MSEEVPEKEELAAISLNRILVDPTAPATVAHAFIWTRVGHEYVLDVGHYDMVAMREAVNKAKEKKTEEAVDFFVTHRFSLGLDTIKRVTTSMKELREDWERLRERDEKRQEEP